MARKKDLGGLAALAGLAYMASRDKAGKGDSAPGVAPSAPAPAKASSDDGDFIEAGSGPAPAADENYGNEGRREGPMAIGKTRTAPRTMSKPVATAAAKAPSNPDYGNEGRRPVKEASSKTSYESPYDRMNRENREQGKDFDSIVRKLTSRKEALPTASDMAYKKGGSVKGWGISRGARKAKIY